MKPKNRWWTPTSQRSSASTGARISPGKFSPTSPKGGFGTNVYEAARYIDEQYGSNYEKYYRQRLLGKSPDDARWRYDLNKHLIGRDYHKTGSYVPSWLPRFPKKKWPKTSSPYIQENNKFRSGQLRSGIQQPGISDRSRFGGYWPNLSNRRKLSNRVQDEICRSTVLRFKRCKRCYLCKLHTPVQTSRTKFRKSRYSRW